MSLLVTSPQSQEWEAQARFLSLLGEQVQPSLVSRLLGANAPILSGSFFALASLGRAERSPSSVHRAGSAAREVCVVIESNDTNG
ncbi:hypothetical protein ACLOJK_004188 [Asimina triloba]